LFDNHRKLAISSSAVLLTRAVIFPGQKKIGFLLMINSKLVYRDKQGILRDFNKKIKKCNLQRMLPTLSWGK
jgi:hypothetical protein